MFLAQIAARNKGSGLEMDLNRPPLPYKVNSSSATKYDSLLASLSKCFCYEAKMVITICSYGKRLLLIDNHKLSGDQMRNMKKIMRLLRTNDVGALERFVTELHTPHIKNLLLIDLKRNSVGKNVSNESHITLDRLLNTEYIETVQCFTAEELLFIARLSGGEARSKARVLVDNLPVLLNSDRCHQKLVPRLRSLINCHEFLPPTNAPSHIFRGLFMHIQSTHTCFCYHCEAALCWYLCQKELRKPTKRRKKVFKIFISKPSCYLCEAVLSRLERMYGIEFQRSEGHYKLYGGAAIHHQVMAINFLKPLVKEIYEGHQWKHKITSTTPP